MGTLKRAAASLCRGAYKCYPRWEIKVSSSRRNAPQSATTASSAWAKMGASGAAFTAMILYACTPAMC